MFKNSLYIILYVLVACLTQACSDDFVNGNSDKEADGIIFTLGVEEQADIIYNMGKTRAAGAPALDSLTDAANTVGAHPFAGSSDGLFLHRMPLPLVGIHTKAVHSEMNSGSSDYTTRAPLSEIAGGGIDFHDSLTIWGFTDKDRTLLNGVLLKKINGWRSHVHWPYDHTLTGSDAGKEDPAYMKFYAISPAAESLEDYTLTTAPDYDTPPVFSYIVPDEIDAQRDLLYGESTSTTTSGIWGNVEVQSGPEGSTTDDPRTENLGKDNKKVNLKFRHILTAIRFAQGKMPVGLTITNIQLYQVKNQGTYTASAGTWGSLDGTATYDIPVTTTVADYNPGSNVYIDGGNVLFLMPQTVASGAQLKITVNDGTDHTLTASLEGDIWLPGYTVTYKVTVGEVSSGYYLVIEPDANYSTSRAKVIPTHNSTGTSTKYEEGSDSKEQDGSGSGYFIIHSFRNFKNYVNNVSGINDHHAEQWRVVGFADPAASFAEASYTYNNAHAVAWVSSFTGWNSGSETQTPQTGGDYVTLNYTMAAQSAAYSDNHQTILTGNNPVTGMNLSTHLPDGSTNTGVAMTGYTTGSIYNSANSYIINAQGTYKFPLVYGNSYQAGAETISNPGGIFKDHLGRTIAHANIFDQINYDIEVADLTDELSSSDQAEGKTKKRITQVRYEGSESELYLIWQDVSGLFTVVSNGFAQTPSQSVVGFANFTVSSTPQPGNGVIALYGRRHTYDKTIVYSSGGSEESYTLNSSTDAGSANEILWTWHIWCTDEVYPNKNTASVDIHYPQYDTTTGSKIPTIYNSDGSSSGNKILPVNLGWVPDEMAWNKYEPREIWVKIEQVNSSEVAYFALRREAKQDLVTGTSTVYQWGRHTALPMVNTIDGSTRTIYDGDATPADITANFQIATVASNYEANAIYQPTKLIKATTKNWWSGSNNLYWNTTKTLYDPSPVGFQIPAKSLFEFLVYTSPVSDDTDYTTLNLWTGAYGSNRGGYFYTKKDTAAPASEDRYGTMIYFPASSYYSGNASDGTTMASQQKDRSVGYFWTSDHASTEEGSSIYFGTSTGKVKWVTEENVDARPVRPKAQ